MKPSAFNQAPSLFSFLLRTPSGIHTLRMFYSLVKLADEMGVRTVWGEATENSAPFYQKLLGVPDVTDHFFIKGEIFQHCLHTYARLSKRA